MTICENSPAFSWPANVRSLRYLGSRLSPIFSKTSSCGRQFLTCGGPSSSRSRANLAADMASPRIPSPHSFSALHSQQPACTWHESETSGKAYNKPRQAWFERMGATTELLGLNQDLYHKNLDVVVYKRSLIGQLPVLVPVTYHATQLHRRGALLWSAVFVKVVRCRIFTCV